MPDKEKSWPGRWAMTTQRARGGLVVYLGAIEIANLVFARDNSKRVSVITLNSPQEKLYESMSAALKEVHRRLQNPPRED